jgi:hypothetical protein
LLEGKLVDLRVAEREDIDFLAEHLNDINENAKTQKILESNQFPLSKCWRRVDP